MNAVSDNRGMIGKNSTTVQAVITKEERKALRQIAKSHDRSESYIVAQIIREHLAALSSAPKR